MKNYISIIFKMIPWSKCQKLSDIFLINRGQVKKITLKKLNQLFSANKKKRVLT